MNERTNCKEIDFNFNFDIGHNYAWAETLSLRRDIGNSVIQSLSPGFKGPGDDTTDIDNPAFPY
jgi:hypothetical protein